MTGQCHLAEATTPRVCASPEEQAMPAFSEHSVQVWTSHGQQWLARYCTLTVMGKSQETAWDSGWTTARLPTEPSPTRTRRPQQHQASLYSKPQGPHWCRKTDLLTAILMRTETSRSRELTAKPSARASSHCRQQNSQMLRGGRAGLECWAKLPLKNEGRQQK